MKKVKTFIKTIPMLAAVVLALSSCSTEENTVKENPSNVTLYDKDAATIQKYIQGKWQVIYAMGGYAGPEHEVYFDDTYVEFTADNKKISSSAVMQNAEKYIWVKEKNIYGTTDYIFVMQIPDGGTQYVMDRIFNDSLIYLEYGVDGMSYHCIRQ